MKHDIDQLRAQLVQLESDEPLRIKTVKQLEHYKVKRERLRSLIELEEFKERQEAFDQQKKEQEALEKERQRQKRITDKFAQRLEEHLHSMQGTVDNVVKNWKDGEALRKEFAELDFNIEPAVLSNFRPEYHAQHMCRVLYSSGFKKIVDEWQRYQPTALPRELKVNDFLTGYTYSKASPEAPMGLEIITEPEE